ncbi:MAG TPA: substrate-binding domain-containing protein [Pseudonocardiaceae bacterium]|nr:substrate-binding domain-containing protein [Pseudonocardiaceae bacterium]
MQWQIRRGIRRAVTLTAVLACALAGASACASKAGAGGSGGGGLSGKVYMLLPNQTTSRYILRDGPQFVAEMKQKAPNVQVVLKNANGDPTTQQQQAENAITAGASLIVLLAADQDLAAGILKEASTAKVPVISYELQANGGPVSAAVLFDPLQVGENQGKYAAAYLNALPGQGIPVERVFGNPGEYGTQKYLVGQNTELDPLVKSGKIKVVCQNYTANWDPTIAQQSVEDCLSANHNNVKAIVTMNDGTALGSVAALKTVNLQGTIPVIGGQDGDLINMQYMLLGWQHDTEYKNIPDLVNAAVNDTVQLLQHPTDKLPSSLTNGVYANGYENVPAFFVAPTAETGASGVADVVKKGGWTWKQICTGPAAATATCKSQP